MCSKSLHEEVCLHSCGRCMWFSLTALKRERVSRNFEDFATLLLLHFLFVLFCFVCLMAVPVLNIVGAIDGQR